MIDNIREIAALVVATISVLITIYNLIFKSERNRKQAYYECLLTPFVVTYKKDKDISAIEFVNSKVEQDNDNIPKYVFYLANMPLKQTGEQSLQQDSKQLQTENVGDEGLDNDEILKKVLIYDYIYFYPNEINMKNRLLGAALKIENLMLLFGFFFFIPSSAFLFSYGVMGLFSLLSGNAILSITIFDYENATWLRSLLEILLGVALVFLGFLCLKITEWLSNDMYTLKKKRILRMINRKVRIYDKQNAKYVF